MISSAIEILPLSFMTISLLGFCNVIVNKYFNTNEGDRIVFYLILLIFSLYLFDIKKTKQVPEKNYNK